MDLEITALESPLDYMRLIHKALRGRGAKVADIAERLGTDTSLQAFRCAFDDWASGLLYFFEKEDAIMSPSSPSAIEAESARPAAGGESTNGTEAAGLAQC